MTALACVGLVVGAGFATGQEVLQYFISFGAIGIVGAVLSGVVMAVGGMVIVQLGSYFLAENHYKVFRNVAHPVVFRFLDWSATFTLFVMGFIMLAGAGCTLQQHFGIPTWMGAGLMTLLVLAVGQLDVDRVSNIVSLVTPLIVIAALVALRHQLRLHERDAGRLHEPGDRRKLPEHPRSPLGRLLRRTDVRAARGDGRRPALPAHPGGHRLRRPHAQDLRVDPPGGVLGHGRDHLPDDLQHRDRHVQIVRETGRRDRIRALLTLREDPRRIYTQNHEKHLERCAEESVADDEAITGAIDVEVLKRHQRERDEPRGEDASSSSTPSS